MALTENFSWIHATLPSHAAIMHRVSVRVMVSGAGDEAGFPQGELLGMSANLRTMANILSPLLWSRVYAAGVRSGKAGLFFCAPSAPPAALLLRLATLGLTELCAPQTRASRR